MKKIITVASVLLLTLGLSACGMSPYKPPVDKQPYALLKLKYSYNAVSDGTIMGSRLHVRHGGEKNKFQVALNKSHGGVKKGAVNPVIPVEAIKIHPGKATDARMAVYFYWYTTQTYTTFINNVPQVQTRQVYHEHACTVELNFVPKVGKEYLLDYTRTSVNKDCSAQTYEKQPRRGGKFKLKRVGKAKAV